MKRALLLIVALVFLFATEILRVYFIMPFPGSQRSDTIGIAYTIGRYIWLLRLAGLLLLLPPAIHVYRKGKRSNQIILTIFILLYALVFYLFNFRFLAEKMFYQTRHKLLLPLADSRIDTAKLVIGICINGQAKAYPLEIIAYHHQVIDTVGGEPVMVTYCSVCRTGRVFSPFVNGKYQHFRLVGMDHFNAMFEDGDTKSWWRQATGISIAGPLQGMVLKELPSQQVRLAAWIRQYPNTLVLQPDTLFASQYKELEGFDDGTIKSKLERRDTGSWKFKSWVIGIRVDDHEKAYDWNELVKHRVINDTIQDNPVVLVLENDGVSFHAWYSQVNDRRLHFIFNASKQQMQDESTHSLWDMNGLCTDGEYKGNHLKVLPVYQEFWHSWQYFHPTTTVYTGN